jgi:diguanylate cyclase (GGDEF)-like protein/PAS domain S-box-containing protein
MAHPAVSCERPGSGQEHWWIIEDLTESLQVQDRLEQAAQVFHHANEGIMVNAADGTILDVNAALCRITGYARDALIGASPSLFRSGEHDLPFEGEPWSQLLAQGEWNGEIVNRARDGSLIPMLATISVLRNGQGAISRFVTLLTDIREQKQQQRQLEALALYDPLTTLPNRALLTDRLERALDRSRRDGTHLAVAFLDLDGFKQVNDLHGHQAGDQLLRVLAGRMQQLLRAGDTLARLGGDEFVLVLPAIQAAEQVIQVVERLLVVIAEPVIWAGTTLCVSGSIGLTLHPVDDADAGPDQLMRHADQAMYAAKRQGRNRLAWFRDAEFP